MRAIFKAFLIFVLIFLVTAVAAPLFVRQDQAVAFIEKKN
jgi:hypothetical protein